MICLTKRFRLEKFLSSMRMENNWELCQKKKALDIAYKQNLDLLCVAPKARPAVCKVLDYGRYHFEQQKKAKEAKRKQHVVEVKSLRLSPIIDTHDFETKVRQTSKMDRSGYESKD